jgi:predicted glycoside hydrolase/deacetylase ChbG (UPF0249 family)
MTVVPHADDLGLHPAVDRAVFRAYEAGAISGASILVTGPTFEQAAAEVRRQRLPLSLHLAIVDTAPLSPPTEIPSLVGADGRFPPYFGAIIRQALLGRLRRPELRREINRQIEAFADAGLTEATGLVLDGHQHLHLLPAVFDVVLDRSEEPRLRAFRLPLRSPAERRHTSPRSLAFALVEVLGRRAEHAAAVRGVQAIPCWGVLHAGHLTLETAREIMHSLPPTATGQLLCHPGDDDRALAVVRPWGYAWEQELTTILALAADRDR